MYKSANEKTSIWLANRSLLPDFPVKRFHQRINKKLVISAFILTIKKTTLIVNFFQLGGYMNFVLI